MVDPFAAASQLADPFTEAGGIAASSLGSPLSARSPAVLNFWGGEKFPGGFGPTVLQVPDYWTLRERSGQLFRDNLYARGLIRRLITNEINTGLKLQAELDADLIPALDELQAEVWADGVESRFSIWAKTKRLCDFEGRRSFADLQKEARREALIEGDILVILQRDRRTGLPMMQLIRGGRVVTPLRLPENDSRNIVNGVELDAAGRQIAYWVREGNSLSDVRRVPAFGPKSGRRLAWLQYGSDKRMDSVRGMPLLGLILQSLKELDRYRDSEQRAATINAMLAMFITKENELPGTRPMSQGAIRKTVIHGDADSTGAAREFNIAEQMPGIVFEELQKGEVPKSFDTSRPNVNYATFESAVVHALAWANEIPPEILTLAFSSNYSASKAAINEFKAYLDRTRGEIGDGFCQPLYTEWLVAEVISGRISAPGFLESRRDPLAYVEAGAWIESTWAGPVKPSVDLGKDVRAYMEAIEANLTSSTRASEDLFGVRFSQVLKRRKRELRAVMAMNDDLGISNDPEPAAPGRPVAEENRKTDALVERVMQEIEDYGAHDRSTH